MTIQGMFDGLDACYINNNKDHVLHPPSLIVLSDAEFVALRKDLELRLAMIQSGADEVDATLKTLLLILSQTH